MLVERQIGRMTINLIYKRTLIHKGIGRHQNDGDFNGHFKHIILIGFFGFQINLKVNTKTRLGLIPFKLRLIVIFEEDHASNYISYCHVLTKRAVIYNKNKQMNGSIR